MTTITVTLSTPIEHNDTTYTEFTFREAETGDLMVADNIKGETSKIVAILACMAETPLPIFKKIKARDLTAIMAKTAALLGETPAATTND